MLPTRPTEQVRPSCHRERGKRGHRKREQEGEGGDSVSACERRDTEEGLRKKREGHQNERAVVTRFRQARPFYYCTGCRFEFWEQFDESQRSVSSKAAVNGHIRAVHRTLRLSFDACCALAEHHQCQPVASYPDQARSKGNGFCATAK